MCTLPSELAQQNYFTAFCRARWASVPFDCPATCHGPEMPPCVRGLACRRTSGGGWFSALPSQAAVHGCVKSGPPAFSS